MVAGGVVVRYWVTGLRRDRWSQKPPPLPREWFMYTPASDGRDWTAGLMTRQASDSPIFPTAFYRSGTPHHSHHSHHSHHTPLTTHTTHHTPHTPLTPHYV